jgi:Tol biopolymer transport system component
MLAHRIGSNVSVTTLTWFDRSGGATPAVSEQAAYVDPALSPDGRFIVVGKLGAATMSDLWIVDLQRGGAQTRITFDPASDSVARWSPDGSHVAFSRDTSGGNGLYRKNVSGVEPEELLLRSKLSLYMNDWTPDGQFLMFHERDPKTRWDIARVPLRGERKSEGLVRSPFNDTNGRISPDGRWMAFMSDDESGRGEVYVTQFPVAKRRIQVSTAGGGAPRWRGDGKELFYFSSAAVMVVDISVSSGGDLQAGVPQKLFEAPNMVGTQWDVTRDGRRFLMSVAPAASATARPIRVVLNWKRQAAP